MEGQPFLAAPLLNCLASKAAANATGTNNAVQPALRLPIQGPGVPTASAVIPVLSQAAAGAAAGNAPASRHGVSTPGGSSPVGGAPLSAMQPGAPSAVNRKRDAARRLRAGSSSTAAAPPSRGSPRVPSSYAAVTGGSTHATRAHASVVNAVSQTPSQTPTHPRSARNAAAGGPLAIDMSPLPTGLDCALSRARATRTGAAVGDAHHYIAGAASVQLNEGVGSGLEPCESPSVKTLQTPCSLMPQI
jgi:hypothetical protein